ncbi:hypothetical protein AB0J86_22300 [Micromonospora sp. NPDC049559]|uniref:hypothetical protein n=1 Tax=Micromonospora sp. NPDC049559 TaxID=3155923 RepID=UPI003436B20A
MGIFSARLSSTSETHETQQTDSTKPGEHHLIRLISHIIETATGQPPKAQVWAQGWFRDQNKRTLHHLAEPPP